MVTELAGTSISVWIVSGILYLLQGRLVLLQTQHHLAQSLLYQLLCLPWGLQRSHHQLTRSEDQTRQLLLSFSLTLDRCLLLTVSFSCLEDFSRIQRSLRVLQTTLHEPLWKNPVHL